MATKYYMFENPSNRATEGRFTSLTLAWAAAMKRAAAEQPVGSLIKLKINSNDTAEIFDLNDTVLYVAAPTDCRGVISVASLPGRASATGWQKIKTYTLLDRRLVSEVLAVFKDPEQPRWVPKSKKLVYYAAFADVFGNHIKSELLRDVQKLSSTHLRNTGAKKVQMSDIAKDEAEKLEPPSGAHLLYIVLVQEGKGTLLCGRYVHK